MPREHWTPKELAELWRCGYDHILTLIGQGTLKAIDVSRERAARRRYLITEESRLQFEQSREVEPIPLIAPVRKSHRQTTDVISFFS